MARSEFVKGKYNSKKAIYNVIHYILNEEKNPRKITNADSLSDDEVYRITKSYRYIQKVARKTSGKRIIHLYVSPNSNKQFSYSDYIKMADAIMDLFDDYQIVYALHEYDNNGNACHKHLHFAINPISYRTGKRFRLTKKQLVNIKKKIDVIVDQA